MDKGEKVQARLCSGSTYLTAWIDVQVKPGQVVTLKDSDNPLRMWTVVSVGEPKKASEIKRGWGMTDVPRGQTPRVV